MASVCYFSNQEFSKTKEELFKLFFNFHQQNHEQALRYITILLAQVVHQTNKRGSMKERLQQLALELSDRYYGSEINCDPHVVKTFNIFKDLVVFFNLYHENKHEMALEILTKTKLVPLSLNELDVCVNNFKKLGGEINKVLPDLLLAAMDIVFKKYKALKSGKDISVFDGSNHDQVRIFKIYKKLEIKLYFH